MNKKIKGYELMKLIAEKQIKERQKFLFTNTDGVEEEIFWDGANLQYTDLLRDYVRCVVGDIEFAAGDFEILEDEEEIDIETKLFEEIAMCLKRLSDKDLTAKPYVDRYEYALKEYKAKKINKED